MKNIDDYLLTSEVTVGDLKRWIDTRDQESKDQIIELIFHRFNNRYMKHLKGIKSAFLMMGICCLMIETLESFIKGKKDTKNIGRQMFGSFFLRESTNFPDFSSISNDFYYNIRCGILHQAETKNAWRLLLNGNLLDLNQKCINVDSFVASLALSLDAYIEELRAKDWTDAIWVNAILKLEDVCANCEPIESKI